MQRTVLGIGENTMARTGSLGQWSVGFIFVHIAMSPELS